MKLAKGNGRVLVAFAATAVLNTLAITRGWYGA